MGPIEADDALRRKALRLPEPDRLFVLGPPTRGRYTEIVAIPDIRLQAADVASSLIAALPEPTGLAAGPAA